MSVRDAGVGRRRQQEQSKKGVIDGVDAEKWAEEQRKDSFCQAAWSLCLKKNKSAGSKRVLTIT